MINRNNVQEIPNADHCFYVREDGQFVKRIVPNKKLENSMYWRNKSRIMGVVMFLCTLFLLATVANETDFIQETWQGLLTFIGGLIW